MFYYPDGTQCAIQLKQIIKHEKPLNSMDRMSTRAVKSAANLEEGQFIGWQFAVPQKGSIEMILFGSDGVLTSDLKWITEKTAKTAEISIESYRQNSIEKSNLYELILPIQMKGEMISEIGFAAKIDNKSKDETTYDWWPTNYLYNYNELIKALVDSGAVYRFVIGAADSRSQTTCRNHVLKTWKNGINMPIEEYCGYPVKIRMLLCLPGEPTLRLKTVLNEGIPGIKLRKIGAMSEPVIMGEWQQPLDKGMVFPDVAARVLMLEPNITSETPVGIKTCLEEVRPIPAMHKNTKAKRAITIGSAFDISGKKREITIGEKDICRHFEVIGQTGTGKSTMLTTMILSAIENGYGMTVFDPHGSTIDNVIRAVPEKYAHRIRVVHIGDEANPVPLNMWSSDLPEKEERTIADLCELFSEIFDPDNKGFVGPRWERWFSSFAMASIALLGKRASFESIVLYSQEKDHIKKLATKLKDGPYTEIGRTIYDEYFCDNSSDYGSVVSWAVSKMQRVTSMAQLRNTLGAGTNALDFSNTIDTDTVTLIDLGMPEIGTHGARIVGTLILQQLWKGIMSRKQRNKTHLVMIDEAHLFQTNPLPRMLAESRKWGIGMVLAHQHCGQLTQDVRDALEANSANFASFCLSAKDARTSAYRLDEAEFASKLCRLSAYNAIATLSVDGKQTQPFTLKTKWIKKRKNGDRIADMIELNSRLKLVEPYRDLRALTKKEMLNAIENPNSPYRVRR